MRCRRLLISTILLFLFLSKSTGLARAGISDTGVDTANGETPHTNPKSRKVTVTASVVDTIPPSIPLLVAPHDTSTQTTTKPTFIWKQSTDEQGMGKYQLWLDGKLVYDNIPIGSTTNTDYTLVYASGEYSLTPKTDLNQGNHTWYIRAYDIYSNFSTSATWSFTIDTIGPLITVTNVGATTQNIRSDNTSSVPLSPIRLTDNTPVVIGTDEVGATLQMILVVPGKPNQITTITMTTTNFSFTLPVLPIDTVCYLNFTSNDAWGNTSVITNIPIIVASATIILPFPSPTAINIPRPIEIIQTAPEEKRLPIIKKVIEALPPAVQTIVNSPASAAIASIIPVLTVAAPAIAVAATAVQTTFSFLPFLFELLSRLLQSLGLIPVKRPRGVVFDTKTGKPIAFATITFIRVRDNQIVDSVISDTNGIYRSIKLPPDTYRIEAVHGDYIFPTKLTPKFLVNAHDFYRGESFEIKSANQEELFLIPMDPLLEETVTKRHFYIAIYFSFLRRILHSLFYPMVLFSIIVTLFFPTILNIAIVILYGCMIAYRVAHSKREPLLRGRIVDRLGTPLPDVMVRCVVSGDNDVAALLLTDDQGRFKTHLEPHQYNLVINKDGYVIEQQSQDYTNVFIGHSGQEGEILIHMMTVSEAFPS